ncbi:glycosyltransferase family 2 protein [Algihabitans albus]|uniref:glycosyltransferase family 2 protein n=1 Tax=Algihabitans albus TaxID=2164067 RepID=UPI000E5C89A0|nr:glycosyltransferase family 2 protein [Algihabitans albus]
MTAPQETLNRSGRSDRTPVSIVVCTRDRADDLMRCLAAIRALDCPPSLQVDVVVVDNGSRDRTAEVVASAAEGSPIPMRRVYLAEPGLARARNAGIQASLGDYILFTDDDCLVATDWLASAIRVMQTEPSIGLAGGQVRLHNSRDLPETIKPSPDLERPNGSADLHGLLLGCNMVIRRSVLDEIGLFDPRFGAGSRFKSSEDTDMVYRVYRAGFGVIYNPQFVVSHNHGRRSLPEIRRLHRGYRIGRGAFYAKHLLHGRLDVLSILLRQLVPHRRSAYPLPSWPRYLRAVVGQFVRAPWLLAGAILYWRIGEEAAHG